MEAIKDAIAELPIEQKNSLTAWLLDQDRKEWDRQMEADFSPGGAGIALLEEAEADIRAGRVKPMTEFLSEVKATRNPEKSSV